MSRKRALLENSKKLRGQLGHHKSKPTENDTLPSSAAADGGESVNPSNGKCDVQSNGVGDIDQTEPLGLGSVNLIQQADAPEPSGLKTVQPDSITAHGAEDLARQNDNLIGKLTAECQAPAEPAQVESCPLVKSVETSNGSGSES